MKAKLMSGAFICLVGAICILWAATEAKAWRFTFKSVDCSHLVKGGTNQNENEQAFVCGIALKEIATQCCNKPGCNNNEDNSSSHVFVLNGLTLKWTTADGAVKSKNGTRPIDVEITDDDIIRIVNVFNEECVDGQLRNGQPCEDVDLSSGGICPPGHNLIWAPSRLDALAMSVLRPRNGSNDFCPVDANGNSTCEKRLYPASVDPRWVASCYDPATNTYNPNPNCKESRDIDFAGDSTIDGQVAEFIPATDIFRDCRREVNGLQFYDSSGQRVLDPKNANIIECLLLRDVNNSPPGSTTGLPPFDPNYFTFEAGLQYDPDTNHFDYPSNDSQNKTFDSPFDGLSDEGGLWLTNLTKGSFFTGTCHQHGGEKVTGGKNNATLSWEQTGPKKPDYLSPGVPNPSTGDPVCTGGAQIYDGIEYNSDGILP